MEKYKANYTTQFRGTNPQFNPNQIGSSANAMQAEFDRQNKGLDRAQDQVRANQQVQENTQKGINNFNIEQAGRLKDLAAFSQTIAGQLTAWGKTQAEKQILEGQQIYYEQGVPDEMQAAWQ